jgi:hypothetical protein
LKERFHVKAVAKRIRCTRIVFPTCSKRRGLSCKFGVRFNRNKCDAKPEPMFIASPILARYVMAKNYGKLPQWQMGAGGKGFIFVDEITVY